MSSLCRVIGTELEPRRAETGLIPTSSSEQAFWQQVKQANGIDRPAWSSPLAASPLSGRTPGELARVAVVSFFRYPPVLPIIKMLSRRLLLRARRLLRHPRTRPIGGIGLCLLPSRVKMRHRSFARRFVGWYCRASVCHRLEFQHIASCRRHRQLPDTLKGRGMRSI